MTAEENPGRAIILEAVKTGKPLLVQVLHDFRSHGAEWEKDVEKDLAKLDEYAKGCRVRAETLRSGAKYAGFLEAGAKVVHEEMAHPLRDASEDLQKVAALAASYDQLADDLLRTKASLKQMMVEQRDSTLQLLGDLIGFFDGAVKAVEGPK